MRGENIQSSDVDHDVIVGEVVEDVAQGLVTEG